MAKFVYFVILHSNAFHEKWWNCIRVGWTLRQLVIKQVEFLNAWVLCLGLRLTDLQVPSVHAKYLAGILGSLKEWLRVV